MRKDIDIARMAKAFADLAVLFAEEEAAKRLQQGGSTAPSRPAVSVPSTWWTDHDTLLLEDFEDC